MKECTGRERGNKVRRLNSGDGHFDVEGRGGEKNGKEREVGG